MSGYCLSVKWLTAPRMRMHFSRGNWKYAEWSSNRRTGWHSQMTSGSRLVNFTRTSIFYSIHSHPKSCKLEFFMQWKFVFSVETFVREGLNGAVLVIQWRKIIKLCSQSFIVSLFTSHGGTYSLESAESIFHQEYFSFLWNIWHVWFVWFSNTYVI